MAFEADSLDTATHAGWSVTIVGQSRAVTGTEEIRRLEQVGLVPWAPGKRDHFIRISPTIVNGRRLAARQWTGDSDANGRVASGAGEATEADGWWKVSQITYIISLAACGAIAMVPETA